MAHARWYRPPGRMPGRPVSRSRMGWYARLLLAVNRRVRLRELVFCDAGGSLSRDGDGCLEGARTAGSAEVGRPRVDPESSSPTRPISLCHLLNRALSSPSLVSSAGDLSRRRPSRSCLVRPALGRGVAVLMSVRLTTRADPLSADRSLRRTGRTSSSAALMMVGGPWVRPALSVGCDRDRHRASFEVGRSEERGELERGGQ